MKKVFVALALFVIIGTVLSSCKSNKPPCPAYRTQVNFNIDTDTDTNTDVIEQIKENM